MWLCNGMADCSISVNPWPLNTHKIMRILCVCLGICDIIPLIYSVIISCGSGKFDRVEYYIPTAYGILNQSRNVSSKTV